MWYDYALRILAGVAGGGLLATKGFIEAWKDGEKFDLQFFIKSLVPSLILGFAIGFISTDINHAFEAGFMGKGFAEVYSALGTDTTKPPVTPPVV